MNCWTLAEYAGYASPGVFQHLLSRARWDHDGVRDDLREFVTERLGTEDSVLVIDETGGREERHVPGGYPASIHRHGRQDRTCSGRRLRGVGDQTGAAFVDRELCVPASWTDDPARCQAAGLPDELEFATKPALALGMVERALAAGARPDWVAADEVYGNDSHLRDALEDLGVGYVLAVSCSTRVAVGPASIRADALARALSPECGQIRSAGAGAKGQRWYQWAYMHLQETSPAGGQRYLSAYT
ncbi:transposase [Streptomyces sp. E11-3]|uniref:IS701 family transposase n=1 Tax=Streptomyces sp. E11-3 TaxID=3110112 RepID=UPI00397F7FF1